MNPKNENHVDLLKEFMATKPMELRLYLILYHDSIDDIDEFKLAYGRWEAYRVIKELCIQSRSDPRDVTILVEYVVKNRNTDRYAWAIMHPENLSSKDGYQFCKAVESSIPEKDRFPIEDYTEIREGEDIEFRPGPNETPSQKYPVTGADIEELNKIGSVEGGEVVSTDDYLAMINNRNQDLFIPPKEDAFDGIKPDYNPFV